MIYSRPSIDTEPFFTVLRELLLMIRQIEILPIDWLCSTTFPVDKNNNKPKCKGVRLLNGYDALSNAYCWSIWKQYPFQHDYHTHGFIAHHRREEAIVDCEVLNERLTKAGLSHIDTFHDLSNAFESTKHDLLDRSIMKHTQCEQDLTILQQRHHLSYMYVDCPDGQLILHAGHGGRQGDRIEPQKFVASFSPHIVEWRKDLESRIKHNHRLVNMCPITRTSVNHSVSGYADDVRVKHLLDKHDPQYVREVVSLSNLLFDSNISKGGWGQNRDKQQHLIRLVGPGAMQPTRALYSKEIAIEGTLSPHARYLGPHLQATGHHHVERNRRFTAARVAWRCMGSFWHLCNSFRWMLIVFQAKVLSSLYTGFICFAASKHDCALFDKVVLGFARTLLRGKACAKVLGPDNKPIKYHAMSSKDIWRHIRQAPSHIELRIQRLRWLQEFVQRPEEHSQIISCIFGEFDFERNKQFHNRCISQHANSYLRQLHIDLQALANFDVSDALDSVIQGYILDLWLEKNVRCAFLSFDLSILRADYISYQIPPPGWFAPLLPEVNDGQPGLDEDKPFVCELTCENGEVCNHRFSTYAALVSHQTSSQGGGHGSHIMLNELVISNTHVYGVDTHLHLALLPKGMH